MSSSSPATSLLAITKLEEIVCTDVSILLHPFRELCVATSTAKVTDRQSDPLGIAGNLYFYDHASNGYTPTATLEKDLCTRRESTVF